MFLVKQFSHFDEGCHGPRFNDPLDKQINEWLAKHYEKESAIGIRDIKYSTCFYDRKTHETALVLYTIESKN